jgi:hypothetical protein
VTNVGTVRTAMRPVSRRVRAYFAPFDRAANEPAVFDPGKSGLFPLDSAPAPWVDLGGIEKFQATSATSLESVGSGVKGGAGVPFRKSLEAHVEFCFCEWGKLQMALAGGSQHMNVLATDPDAGARASGGIPLPGMAVLDGSTESEIVLGAGSVDTFAVGDLVAVDLDYAQQTGWVGSGIAGAYVKDPADVLRDRDYVRRVTFNIGRVAAKTATSLLLAQSLLGGAPLEGASAQKVVAFVDREGGSFFQDWSALFAYEDESGGRICVYYPHLVPGREAGGAGVASEVRSVVEEPLGTVRLRASFTAVAHRDENDGEAVLSYRSYFPAGMSAVY